MSRTLRTVAVSRDVIFGVLGGAPTFTSTVNEKPITTGHVAGLAVGKGGGLAVPGRSLRGEHPVGDGEGAGVRQTLAEGG